MQRNGVVYSFSTHQCELLHSSLWKTEPVLEAQRILTTQILYILYGKGGYWWQEEERPAKDQGKNFHSRY